jgi:cytochrome c oxidase assembly protein subunit 15
MNDSNDVSTGFAVSGVHRYATCMVFATLFLIVAGGLVTSTGSGLAVPDWPLANGQLFPEMVGGVFYEHGHRLVATAIGILTIILTVWLWRADPRPWMRKLGLVALAAVVCQGLLGGLTVILNLPPAVSVAHACLGQLFFATIVAIAVMTAPGWLRPPPAVRGDLSGLATLSAATTTVIFIQLLLGAVMRHTASGLAIPDFPLAFGRLVPPAFDAGIAIHFAHRIGALVVTVFVLLTAWRVVRRHGDLGTLIGPALTMVGIVPIQIMLGGMTVLSMKDVVPTTAHVVLGAVLLGSSVVLTLRSGRLLGVAERLNTADRAGGTRHADGAALSGAAT